MLTKSSSSAVRTLSPHHTCWLWWLRTELVRSRVLLECSHQYTPESRHNWRFPDDRAYLSYSPHYTSSLWLQCKRERSADQTSHHLSTSCQVKYTYTTLVRKRVYVKYTILEIVKYFFFVSNLGLYVSQLMFFMRSLKMLSLKVSYIVDSV